MFYTRVKSDTVGRRLDAGFYNPDYVVAQSAIARFPIRTMESLRADDAPIGYGVVKPRFQESSVRMVRIQDFSDPFVDLESSASIDPEQMTEFKRSACQSGDLLVAIGGYPGRLGLLPPLPDGVSAVNINQHVVRVRFAAGVDRYFVTAFLLSSTGRRLLARQVSGSVQAGINVEDFRLITIPYIGADAQRYIGDKVRQTERLRSLARRLRSELNNLLSIPALADSLRTAEQRANRVRASDLFPRLDSKYYGNRAMAVLKAAGENGVSIGSLVAEVNNGFEHRDFDPEGTPYITVTEVSGGRLELATAPRLGAGVAIPKKASIDTRCALVVRTGSIGVAVPVFEEDTHATISSHLIRLRFKSEEEASVVAAFLNSEAGRVLQRKISYGVVQPQIGQDELLALPIPTSLLSSAESILHLLKSEDAALRAAKRLTLIATNLVERLIDGHIAEAELVAAQKALEAGDRSVDRGILKALRESDATAAKLFIADVDGIYALLDASEGQDT